MVDRTSVHFVNLNGETNSLIEAIKVGDLPAVSDILENAVQHNILIVWLLTITSCGIRPLYQAAKLGFVDIVVLLVQYGFNDWKNCVSAIDDGKSPQHAAAEHGHLELLSIIYDNFGVDLGLKSAANEETPMY